MQLYSYTGKALRDNVETRTIKTFKEQICVIFISAVGRISGLQ